MQRYLQSAPYWQLLFVIRDFLKLKLSVWHISSVTPPVDMTLQMKMDTVVNEANEQHLAPWLGMLKQHGIKNTPLSPFLHKQLLMVRNRNSACRGHGPVGRCLAD